MAEAQSRLIDPGTDLRHPSRLVLGGGAALAVAYIALWFLVPFSVPLLERIWFLPGVGVIGAIIANSSGTGGGVVFVPVFNGLRDYGVMSLDPLRVTAVSMGIQAFGMSLGALRWTDRLYHQPHLPSGDTHASVAPRDYWKVSVLVLALSLPAMLLTQRVANFDGNAILLGYKTFSIILGTALIFATWTVNRDLPERRELSRGDVFALALIAVPGGIFTALFSVGIGELVAFYLFLRHYPILMAVGTACVISSASMIAGSVWQIEQGLMQWEIVLLAAPGAMLGAFLARPIAYWLGPRKLKTAGGAWIVLSALYLLWLNWN